MNRALLRLCLMVGETVACERGWHMKLVQRVFSGQAHRLTVPPRAGSWAHARVHQHAGHTAGARGLHNDWVSAGGPVPIKAAQMHSRVLQVAERLAVCVGSSTGRARMGLHRWNCNRTPKVV